jgi:hypothetical protein
METFVHSVQYFVWLQISPELNLREDWMHRMPEKRFSFQSKKMESCLNYTEVHWMVGITMLGSSSFFSTAAFPSSPRRPIN